MARYDAAVIGSGPAGLEAALNLKARNKNFVLFGSTNLSRKVETARRIDNYLGFPGITGPALQERFSQHLAQMEISLTPHQVQMIYPMGDYFSLTAGQEMYEASAVILATGVSVDRHLDGEEEFLGRGVSYCATCDAPLYKNKTVAVLGYMEEAVHEAEFLAEIASKVYYFPMKPTDVMPAAPVEIQNEKATGVAGDTAVKSLLLGDKALAVDGVFILRETLAPSSLIPGIGLRNGFIQVDENMATTIPGCFAAGDCTGKPHQYMRAAGQGQVAALSAAFYIDKRKKK